MEPRTRTGPRGSGRSPRASRRTASRECPSWRGRDAFRGRRGAPSSRRGRGCHSAPPAPRPPGRREGVGC
eukprot:8763831-Alexandrium_andersonii.AAC.1